VDFPRGRDDTRRSVADGRDERLTIPLQRTRTKKKQMFRRFRNKAAIISSPFSLTELNGP
jgi:hypothetical protein